MPRAPALPLPSVLATEAANVDVRTFTLAVPIRILLEDAIHIAAFTADHWRTHTHPRTKVVLRRGLDLVSGPRFPRSIANEIVLLHELLLDAHTSILDHALVVLDALSSALHWRCAETPIDDTHTTLAAITARHRDASSIDALAAALADHLALATHLRTELTAIGAFDPQLLLDAEQLVHSLRSRTIRRRASHTFDQRNRWAAMLVMRINLVRAAARYVFRHDDDLLARIATPYARRVCAAQSRAALVHARAA